VYSELLATSLNNLQINNTLGDVVDIEFSYTALLVFCGGSEISKKASVAILMFLLPQEYQT
jgi:hypothetical protein